jgi:DNA-binding transcriptional MerR regulator
MQAGRYAIEELADLAGVSRRTVRYYVQEGLLQAPLGRGRGRHYGPEHLERLLQVKGLQEQGKSLTEVKAAIGAGGRAVRAASAQEVRTLPRSAWARVELMPGVELHLSSAHRLPAPGRLAELAEWCRLQVRRNEEKDDA